MDPLSLTCGIVGLLTASKDVYQLLKWLHEAPGAVNERVSLLMGELGRFISSMESVKDLLELEQMRSRNGDVAKHWRNIRACLNEGEMMLRRLETKLRDVNRDVGFMNLHRKAYRLRSCMDEITLFQQQFRSCQDTVQTCLHVALLWNQMSAKDIRGQGAVPGIFGELTSSIQRVTKQLFDRMVALGAGANANDPASEGEMASLKKFNSCLQSAATVVAKTESIAPSGLHDIRPSHQETRVVARVRETSRVDLEHIRNDGFPIPAIEVHGPVDDGVEDKLMNLHIAEGKQELNQGNFASAEHHLERGLDHLRRLKSTESNLCIRTNCLGDLAEVYRRQEKWKQAKHVISERMALLSRTVTADSAEILDQRFALADVCMWLNELGEAHRHVKICIHAYSQRGTDRVGLEVALGKMIDLCVRQKDAEGEEDYRMWLAHISGPISAPVYASGLPLAGLGDEEMLSVAMRPDARGVRHVAIGIPKSSGNHRRASNPEPRNLGPIPVNRAFSDRRNRNIQTNEGQLPTGLLNCRPALRAVASAEGMNNLYPSIQSPGNDAMAPRLKALFVGNASSGKTSLISRCMKGPDTFALAVSDPSGKRVYYGHRSCTLPRLRPNPSDTTVQYEDTRTLTPNMNLYSVEVDGSPVQVELVLWDTPGPKNGHLFLDTVQDIADGISCIVLCFDVDEPFLLADIETTIRSMFRDRPIVLAGTKIDLRDMPRRSGCDNAMSPPFNRREGLHLAQTIGASEYVDCSAKTGEGVEELVTEIVKHGLEYVKHSSEHGSFKLKWKRSMERLIKKP